MQAAAEQFEIVSPRDSFELRDALLVIGRYGADEGDVDAVRLAQAEARRGCAGSNARWTTSARAPCCTEEIHHRGHLRDQEIVDRPILAARGRDADLADQDRAADPLDPARQARVDVEQILVEDEVRLEVLDLRQQDLFGLRIEARA